MKLKFEKLCKENFDECLKLKHLLFPESNSDKDYEKYFSGNVLSEYFLAICGKDVCAITGWYAFDETHENAFMGWFGVHPNFRNKGIGSKVFDFTLDRVKKAGFNYFRLYTDKVVNKASVQLYTKKSMTIEPYTFGDALGKTGNFVVFTKVIESNGNDLWNNRPLGEDDNYDF